MKNLQPNASDEELEFQFAVAEALGATHVTLELPAARTRPRRSSASATGRLKQKIYAAYHTHAQGSMTAFDEAFALSKGNMANVDFGHFVGGRQQGGTPMDFLKSSTTASRASISRTGRCPSIAR